MVQIWTLLQVSIDMYNMYLLRQAKLPIPHQYRSHFSIKNGCNHYRNTGTDQLNAFTSTLFGGRRSYHFLLLSKRLARGRLLRRTFLIVTGKELLGKPMKILFFSCILLTKSFVFYISYVQFHQFGTIGTVLVQECSIQFPFGIIWQGYLNSKLFLAISKKLFKILE